MAELAIWTDPLTESNCYVLGEAGACVVIDPNGHAGPLSLLEARGWTPERILLTHEHCDHMAGLESLRERFPSATVLTSALCSAGIQSTRLNMSRMMEVYLTFRGKPGVSYPPFVCQRADRLFSGPFETTWRGHRLRFVPLPGHTPGSTGIFWEEEIFFSGDYLIPNEEVVLRLPGGSAADYEAITRPFLAGLPRGLCLCPGHGAPYRR